MMKQFRDELTKFVGLVVIALLIVGTIGIVIYGLLGNLPNTAIQLVATILIMLIPIAYALGLREGKAHRSGLERGIDLKLGARERDKARPAAQPMTSTAPARSGWDDLLPRPESGAIIVARSSGDNTPIDL